ncbi:MAG: DUF366 family protein [candidate division WOR-3 bacterium]|nr:DUF366 family protein [candidate division WOR-3 bacterium]MDH5683628.1 DUF366 family protein [candidate division WOR-3 bacterium]
MRTRFIKEEIVYTGEQLHSLFAYDTFGVTGDSIVAFIGAYDVSLKEIVDLEDLKSSKRYVSSKMLHFIAEHFDVDLEKAILRQYLLVAIIKELLNEKMSNLRVTRIGTELYDNETKLAISTATASPVSSLVYVGVNIIGQNDTPVKTKGMADYKIDPIAFGAEVMDRYSKEVDKVAQARCRIRWVE